MKERGVPTALVESTGNEVPVEEVTRGLEDPCPWNGDVGEARTDVVTITVASGIVFSSS